MRILLVAHKFPPYSLGGVEVYTRHLARALACRHQVAVFYRHDGTSARDRTLPFAEYDEVVDGIATRRVSLNPRGIRGSVAGEFLGTFLNRDIEKSFAHLLDEFQPDLIHFQHVMALSAHLLPLARRWGAPTLLTLHDYWFLCGNSQLIWPDRQVCRGKAWGINCVRCAVAARVSGTGLAPLAAALRPALAPLFLYRDRVVRRAALAAGQLIAPSRFLIEQYVAAGFPPGRFVYLENGLPLDHIHRAVAERKEAGPLRSRQASRPLRVTFLGSLAWQKGVHILARAFEGLPPGAARLRVWGDPAVFPDYAARLRHLLDRCKADARLMGRIPNERVGEVLAESDVVVVPSLWYENSPIVIQEARAAGVPVIASDHGALAEKVRHGVDGLLFPPGDAAALRSALARLWEEPQLLSRLREGIRPPNDMAGHVTALEALYREHR